MKNKKFTFAFTFLTVVVSFFTPVVFLFLPSAIFNLITYYLMPYRNKKIFYFLVISFFFSFYLLFAKYSEYSSSFFEFIVLISFFLIIKNEHINRQNIKNFFALFGFIISLLIFFGFKIDFTLQLILVVVFPFYLFEISRNVTFIFGLLNFLALCKIGNQTFLIIVFFDLVVFLVLDFFKKNKNLNNIIIKAFFIFCLVFMFIFSKMYQLYNFSMHIIFPSFLFFSFSLFFLIAPGLKIWRKKSCCFPYLLSIINLFSIFAYFVNVCSDVNCFALGFVFILLFKIYTDIVKEKLILNEDSITIMALHLGYGGIEKYISSLCTMLSSDYKLNIISTYKLYDEVPFDFCQNTKITYLIEGEPNKEALIQSIKNRKMFKCLKELIKAANILYKKYTYNIMAIESIDSKYVVTTRDFHNELVGMYASEDVIKIATEHNYHNYNKKYIRKVSSSVKYFDYFVLVSKSLCDFYTPIVTPKTIYIPNVLDSIPMCRSDLFNHNIISVGRLSKEKGQADLLEIISLVKKRYQDVKLYLVGDGPEKDNLKKIIKVKNLGKNVVLTGFLNKNDIELKMLDSSVFVTTSYTESFGLAVLEASSYHLPIVAFDSAVGICEILSDGGGVLIKNRDKEKMKMEIIKIFDDTEYRNSLGKKGYENCKQYLAENVKKKWLELLK